MVCDKERKGEYQEERKETDEWKSDQGGRIVRDICEEQKVRV